MDNNNPHQPSATPEDLEELEEHDAAELVGAIAVMANQIMREVIEGNPESERIQAIDKQAEDLLLGIAGLIDGCHLFGSLAVVSAMLKSILDDLEKQAGIPLMIASRKVSPSAHKAEGPDLH